MTFRAKLNVLYLIVAILGAVLAIGVSYKGGAIDGLRELLSDAVQVIDELRAKKKAPPDPKKEPAPAAPSADEIFWRTIKDSDNRAPFEEYLKQFTASLHAAEARQRINTLTPPAAKEAPSTETLPPKAPQPDLPKQPARVILPVIEPFNFGSNAIKLSCKSDSRLIVAVPQNGYLCLNFDTKQLSEPLCPQGFELTRNASLPSTCRPLHACPRGYAFANPTIGCLELSNRADVNKLNRLARQALSICIEAYYWDPAEQRCVEFTSP
jgi:hypothetical protein